MVSANPQGDGIVRNVQYASFRTDKAASPGYSTELISKRVKPEFYDDLGAQPQPDNYQTILQYFKRNVAAMPNEPYLGTREKLDQLDSKGKPTFGEYQWKTFAQTDRLAMNLAKGLMALNLCPQITEEDQLWRFVGIWAKNCWEWTTTLLAAMHYSITAVGFYDAMSVDQVDFILNQTEMSTIVCTADYAKKLIDMKKSGKAVHVNALIVTGDSLPAGLAEEAQQVQIQCLTFSDVCAKGEQASNLPFEEPTKDDVYIFSYTSGTTGDSKGVKLTHENVLSCSRSTLVRVIMNPGETLISYLPYTHSFEQSVFGFGMIQQLKIGFYTGDPAKLVEDCQKLQPHFFPSVPRLYNRIYSKLRAGLDAATGCKRWLATRAVDAKIANYNATGVVTHGCWDALIFKKMSALLGGQVRYMVTGSAPIDKAVIDFLKICFSCPIVEGYGLTESAAGSCIMDVEDSVTGHVGGPIEAVKFRLKDLPEMNYTSSDKPYPRGEICMLGPCIFKGYYKRQDKTDEAFDAEGWFLTGDVGMVYPNGSIKIIDRSKNIFKLSQGEYIAPEKIEQIMGLSQWIAQVFLYGDSFQNACVSIVVPEESEVKRWATANGKQGDFATLCQDAELKEIIKQDWTRIAVEKKLSSLEKPKEFILWSDLFSIENNLITSTFKLKRNIAKTVFKPQIDQMYKLVEAAEAKAAASRA